MTKSYRLTGPDGKVYESLVPGTLGGNRRTKVYGSLRECRSARRALDRGTYMANRVFFADEATATAAGYRPCGACMRAEYEVWKKRKDATLRGRDG